MTCTLPKSLSRHRLLAAAAALLLHAATSQGVQVPPGTPHPGIDLGPGTTIVATGSLAGTVLANQTVTFEKWVPEVPNHPIFTGTLRSLVVRRADTSTLDFYYQLVNTTQTEDLPDDGDIFEFTIEHYAGWGFPPDDALDLIYRTDGLDGLTGAGAFTLGTIAPRRGFREPEAFDTVGFNINPNFFAETDKNLNKGETSLFQVVRTTATDFAIAPALVTGLNGGAVTTQAYAPVPEPGAIGLMALGALSLGFSRRRAAS